MTKRSLYFVKENEKTAHKWVKMHARGMSYTDIADRTGLTREYVYQFIQRYTKKGL